MAVCPKGHDSAADDYCDVCGTPIAVRAQPAGPPAASSAGAPPACPSCGSPLDGRFCERCGQDSLAAPVSLVAPVAPVAPAPSSTVDVGSATGSGDAGVTSAARAAGTSNADETRSWLVVVTADREYFDRVRAMHGPDVDSVDFPRFCPERRFPLDGPQILIGRRSRSRGVYPEIDLAGPPEDSAVSHTHALLLPQPGGTWAVVDLRSRNCTYVNGDAEPIDAEVPIPLRDGDHLNVGAWTRLTLRAGS